MTKKKKRTYQPPRIVGSEVFERLALACNGSFPSRAPIKGAPIPPGCNSVRNS